MSRYIVADADGLWGDVRAESEDEARAYLAGLVERGETALDMASLVLTEERGGL